MITARLKLALTEFAIDAIKIKKGDNYEKLIDLYIKRISLIYETNTHEFHKIEK